MFGLRMLAAVALVLGPLASAAAPLFFTVGSDGYALGVSEADAQASGLAILPLPPAREIAGDSVSVDIATVPGSVQIPQNSTVGMATQNYTLTNQMDPGIGGTFYLFLASFDTAVVQGYTHDYLGSYSEPVPSKTGDPTTVGLDLTPDWFIFSLFDAQLQETLYFPAIALGDLGLGDDVTVPIGFVLTDRATVAVLEGSVLTNVLMLPQMLYGVAFFPIPEPSTGLLVALGLCGMAWRGQRRSCARR